MSDIYLSLTETPSVVTLSQPVVASVMVNTVTVANVVSVNVVTMPAINVTAAVSGGLTNTELRASAVTVALDAASLAALESVTVTVGNVTIGSAVTIAGFSTSSLPPSTVTVANTVTISGTVTANLSAQDQYGSSSPESGNFLRSALYYENISGGNGEFLRVNNQDNALPIQLGSNAAALKIDGSAVTQPISGTVTASIANSITIGSLPVQLSTTTIGGTARLNVTLSSATTLGAAVPSYGNLYGGSDGTNFRAINVDSSGRTVVTGSVNVAGTVTANLAQYGATAVSYSGSTVTAIPVQIQTNGVYGGGLQGYNGQHTYLHVGIQNLGGVSIGSGVTMLPTSIGNTVTVAQAAAVTVGQLPRVTFIDGSGSVTTANTAITVFATSTTRSYLLVQVTTGSAFVNVGATATTVNGINLTAGQGYAWETTIPQGLVSLISTTTSSRWVAKEA